MMILLVMSMMVVGETTGRGVSVDWWDDPTQGSVDILNALNESVAMHCWSREANYGLISLASGADYSWNFHPNIFGRTLFACSFLWRGFKQEFSVWKGSHYDDQPRCCTDGPCHYKILHDGIYTDEYYGSPVLVAPWLKI